MSEERDDELDAISVALAMFQKLGSDIERKRALEYLAGRLKLPLEIPLETVSYFNRLNDDLKAIIDTRECPHCRKPLVNIEVKP